MRRTPVYVYVYVNPILKKGVICASEVNLEFGNGIQNPNNLFWWLFFVSLFLKKKKKLQVVTA